MRGEAWLQSSRRRGIQGAVPQLLRTTIFIICPPTSLLPAIAPLVIWKSSLLPSVHGVCAGSWRVQGRIWTSANQCPGHSVSFGWTWAQPSSSDESQDSGHVRDEVSSCQRAPTVATWPLCGKSLPECKLAQRIQGWARRARTESGGRGRPSQSP